MTDIKTFHFGATASWMPYYFREILLIFNSHFITGFAILGTWLFLICWTNHIVPVDYHICHEIIGMPHVFFQTIKWHVMWLSEQVMWTYSFFLQQKEMCIVMIYTIKPVNVSFYKCIVHWKRLIELQTQLRYWIFNELIKLTQLFVK